MIVARTTLWLVFAGLSVAAVYRLSHASLDEIGAQLSRLRDAPAAIRESPRLVYLAGAAIGGAVAALVLAGVAMFLRA